MVWCSDAKIIVVMYIIACNDHCCYELSDIAFTTTYIPQQHVDKAVARFSGWQLVGCDGVLHVTITRTRNYIKKDTAIW